MTLCPFLGYSTMMVFLMPLSKRCTGAQTIGEIHCGAWCEYSGYCHGGFVRNVTHQRFIVVTIRFLSGSIKFLRKNNIST
jgi:hypothetical protein